LHGKYFFLFVEWIVKVIHRVLTTYVEGDAAAGIPKKKLPRVLYLQLDNTAKWVLVEQKNKNIRK
jgi:hypothetical protein